MTSLRPQPRNAPPAPTPTTPSAQFAAELGLSGALAYRVVDAATGVVLDEFNPAMRLPPASVAKAATAFYALNRLGAAHRFHTRLLTNGPVRNGRVEGDLVLQGGGDPLFDSDAMGDMVAALKEQGIHEITGRFYLDASALPTLDMIDPEQPPHVSYNPSISGLNLNFNRVHFQWKRTGKSYDLSMEARARRFSPAVGMARMRIEDRSLPVYTYAPREEEDHWTVARRALGNGGARWLPVRWPEAYAADVFSTIARSYGIVLRPGNGPAPAAGLTLVDHSSAPLSRITRSMLKYSTNLTAEVLGLTATQAGTDVPPQSLIGSARAMNHWFNRVVGTRSTGFVDHSGLSDGSRVSAADLSHLMVMADRGALVPALMKEFRTEHEGVLVSAKTGTLNFVSTLAGFIEAPGLPRMAFAILTADMEQRRAIRPEDRERPPGARGWSRRSRTAQKKLIERWLGLAGG